MQIKKTPQSLLILSFVYLLLCCQATKAQTKIPFEVSPQGHIMIKTTFNNVEGNFLFDTGGGMTMLTKKFADRIGALKKMDGGYTAFRATGERIDVDLYQATSLKLGSIAENNPLLTYIDVDFGPIDGLISLMTFKNQPFTIDYSNKVIVLENRATLTALKKTGHLVPLQLDISRDKTLGIAGYFTLNKKVNLQLIIDSGAGTDVFRINSKYTAQLDIDTAKAVKILKPSEFDSKFKTTIYRANIAEIASTAFPAINKKNINAAFIPGLIYDGIISLNWIGNKITFDLTKAEMIVQ